MRIGTVEAILKLRDEFTGVLGRASTELAKHGERMKKTGRQISEAGEKLTTSVSLPVALLGGFAIKTAKDFETSFAGIVKTVSDATDEMGNLTATGRALQQGMRDLAKEMPVNVNELNRIGEAAGQLGIESENILEFTEVMAKLGVTTNLTADQAATALARLANITQLPQSEFDRLGSTIVALGNNFATTEAEIVEMGLRIAGAGKQIGLTEGQILAFSTALSSVGIEAEAGGSAISRVMINIALAVSRGGKELQQFASVSGQSSQQFRAAFQQDAAGAINSFIAGLGKMQESGGNVLSVLEEMGITEVRMRDALLRAAGAGDLLTRSLQVQATAWTENNALTKEAEQRFKTFDSQLAITWNQLKDVGITLGTAVLPVLRDFLELLRPVIDALAAAAQRFSELPKSVRTTAVAFAALLVAAGPVLKVAGMIMETWGTLAAFLPTLGAALAKVIGVLTGPVGWIAAAIALLLAWKPVREFLIHLGGQILSAVIASVKSVIAWLQDWWASTEEGRRFLGALVSVIADDLGKAIRAAVLTIQEWLRKAVDFVTAVKDIILYVLEWTGVLPALRVAVDSVKLTLVLLWQWVIKAKNAVIDWIDTMGGLARVVSIVNPAMGAALSKMEDWAKRAKASIEWSDKLAKSTEALANAKADLASWHESLDAAMAAEIRRLEEAATAGKNASGSIGGMSDALQDALASIADSVSEHRALLAAIKKSQHEYDKLNSLLAAGVPLADALTGAYDSQIEILSKLQKELALLLGLRSGIHKLSVELQALLDLSPDQVDLFEALKGLGVEAADALRLALGSTETAADAVTNSLAEMIARLRRLTAEAQKLRDELDKAIAGATGNATPLPDSLPVPELSLPDPDIFLDWEKLNQQNEEYERRQREHAEKIAQSWTNIAQIMANGIEDHNEGLAQTIRLAINLVAMWRQLAALQKQGASAGEKMAAGAGMGAVIGQFGQQQGLWDGNLGTSSWGGSLGGDYGDLGAQIGGAIGAMWGPLGAAVGGFLGGMVGGMVKRGADEFIASMKVTAESSFVGIWKSEGQLSETGNSVADAITKGIQGILDMIDGELANAANIEFKIRGDSIAVIVNGIRQGFETLQEAIDYAIRYAIIHGEVLGVSPEIAATLANTYAASVEELNKELAYAVQSRNLRLGEFRTGLRQQIENFWELFQAELRQGIVKATGESQGMNAIVEMFQASHDQLLGITKDAGEMARQRAEAHNAELTLFKAKLLATKADLVSKLADIQTTGVMARVHREGARSIVESAYAIAVGTEGAVRAMLAHAETTFVLGEAFIIAIQAIEDAEEALEGLELSQDEIERAVQLARNAANGAGGAAGDIASDLERLGDELDRLAKERLGPAQQAMADFATQWTEYRDLAHGNTAALARLNEEMAIQRRLLVEQLVGDFYTPLVDFEAVFTTPLGEGLEEIRTQAEDLRDGARDLAEALGFSGERLARMLERITEAEQARIAALATEGYAALLGEVANLIQDDKLRSRLLQEQARIEFVLKLAQYEREFLVLQALGVLTEAQLALLREGLDWINANQDKILANVTRPIQTATTATQDLSDAASKMAERLARAKESITDFLLALQRGEFGGKSNKESFDEAFAQFQKIRQGIRAGNIQAAEDFPEFARTLLDLARQRLGSTDAFQTLLAEVRAAGVEALGLDRVREDNVVFDARFFDLQSQHLDIDRAGYAAVLDGLKQGFGNLAVEEDRSRVDIVEGLKDVTKAVGSLRDRLGGIENRLRTERKTA